MQMFQFLIDDTKEVWTWLKDTFHKSETILLARLQVIIGFITAVCSQLDFGVFTNLDWSTGLSKNQAAWLGIGVLVNGIITEIARRRNTIVAPTTNQLLPENITTAQVKAAKK